MTKNKLILDACCGSKMFWFDKNRSDVLYMDIRKEDLVCCDGRTIKVRPDLVADFRNMPFDDCSFKMVIYDPPHDIYAGKGSYTSQKYGNLNKDSWKEDLKKALTSA